MRKGVALALHLIALIGIGLPVVDSADVFAAHLSPPTDFLARTRRVEEIGYRIAQANPGLCLHARPLLGMTLHDAASYSKADRARVNAMYGFGQDVAIARVITGGPASQAGLNAGDVILASGTIRMATYRTDLVKGAASYERIAAIERLLENQIEAETSQLTVRRPDGGIHIVKLADHRGCLSRFVVTQQAEPNAWSDENGVAVTAGLVDLLVSDDALAFALAHETAHVLLCHACRQSPRILARLGIGSRNWRAAEFGADAMAVTLTKAAHYDPNGAFVLLKAIEDAGYGQRTGTHPGAAERIKALISLM